jgi:phosphate transport system permease protein
MKETDLIENERNVFVNDHQKIRNFKNKLLLAVVVFFSALTTLPIILIVGNLLVKGYHQINLAFFTQVPPDSFTAMMAKSSGQIIPGGIVNGITGTILMVGFASLIAIPFGILIGIYLYEKRDTRYANLVRNITDVLQGVPSIVIGLITYLWVVVNITKGYSALAGSISLSIMMLPLIIRSTEETMKMIPSTLKEAAVALGTPYHKVIFKVLIPSSLGGLMTGILISISRILGETAPLLLTALGNPAINWKLSQPTSSVPLLIWQFYNDPNMVSLIFSSSLFLMGFVLTLNLISKRIAAKRSIQ